MKGLEERRRSLEEKEEEEDWKGLGGKESIGGSPVTL